jgi:hypothetical protein
MILLSYAQANALAVLERLFGGETEAIAYTSEWLLKHEIEAHVARYPENATVVQADWLHQAKVKGEDNIYAQRLIDLWSEPGRNRGEAEVLALCSRYGWTAVLDDRKGRAAAVRAEEVGRPFPVRHVWGATMLAAATADNLISLADGWSTHQSVEARYDDPPVMPTSEEYEQAFEWAVTAIRKHRDRAGSPAWPRVLALELDPIVKAAVSKRWRELH